MKQTIIVAAAAAVCSGGALAQSSVTIGGVMDAAARSVANSGGGSVKSLVSGANSTSRLYFRGNEELGNGLSAGFWIESGINIDAGTSSGGTQFWDRRATLSLASKPAGEVRLGRDYTPTYTTWSRHDVFSHVGVAGSNNFSSAAQQGPIRNAFGTNPNTTVRSSNSVQYILPAGLGGVEGALMLAAGEGGTAANGQHKLIGGRLAWQTKVFGVSAAYATTENDLTASGKFKDGVIGANGAIGPVRLTAALRRYEQSQAKQTNLMLGALGSIGATDLKLSYLQANLQGRVGATSIDNNDARQIGLGVVYNLSKRTGLYAQAARIENEGTATFVIPGGTTLPAGGRSTGWEAGLRHNF